MSNQFARLPLQRKVSATLLLTIAVFAAISYTILTAVITPAFENLELSVNTSRHRESPGDDGRLG
jgi:hypothetical protein